MESEIQNFIFHFTSKMETEEMEQREIEKELASLLERTFAWEDELNSLLMPRN